MTRRNVLERIELVRGDITEQRVDSVVNAANTSLLGGGGVDGAIHQAAGPGLLEETRTLGGCPTGEARITPGYNLPARWIIHTVGPVWSGGDRGEASLLRRCYRNAFAIAGDPVYDIYTIALPGISIGVYGYPVEEATMIALEETAHFLRYASQPEFVRFVLFSNETLAVYADRLEALVKMNGARDEESI